MNMILKGAAAVTLAGALAASVVTPSDARMSRAGAAAIGFGAGAVVGAAAANAANHGYYYGPSYGYAPAPGYRSYAYTPGYAYGYAPTYGYANDGGGCATQGQYPGSLDYSACGGD